MWQVEILSVTNYLNDPCLRVEFSHTLATDSILLLSSDVWFLESFPEEQASCSANNPERTEREPRHDR